MNTRNITPITSWSPENGNITVDKLILKDFIHYFFDGGSGWVSYALQDSSTQMEYFAKNMEIPSSTIQQWGASDDIIFEYVANQLNLTIIN
jgi:hypothetical protein